MARWLVRFAAASFVGGVAFFWMPEHVFLDCDHPLQRLHLHSLWHVAALGGTLTWFRWAVLDRDLALAATQG